MFRSSFQEERVVKDSKLQAVFSKLSGVLPRAEDFQGNSIPKIMSSDIIESVLSDTPVPVPTSWPTDTYCYTQQQPASSPPQSLTDDVLLAEDCAVVASSTSLCHRLEQELRNAKRSHLSCGEVLLPCGLLQRVARDIVSMAESEPCGLRGCQLFLLFDAQQGTSPTKIGKIVCDPETACTFELYLTLKQNSIGWNFLPQFLRNLTRGGTVVISPAYTLIKKKLYRSYMEQIVQQ
ncbi:protein charybde-like [Cylas formicarius]|uniref:protein charybde-like n=1 Tax=Cylas formicarius TaxID=197179 RepID=UPI002958629F|nr:protein charybde-like [Cylas formicarius]